MGCVARRAVRLPHAPTAAQALARVLAVCSSDVVYCAHQRTLVGVVIIVGKQAGSQSIVERALAQQHAAAAVGVGGTVDLRQGRAGPGDQLAGRGGGLGQAAGDGVAVGLVVMHPGRDVDVHGCAD